jgi:hypothetical protein
MTVSSQFSLSKEFFVRFIFLFAIFMFKKQKQIDQNKKTNLFHSLFFNLTKTNNKTQLHSIFFQSLQERKKDEIQSKEL